VGRRTRSRAADRLRRPTRLARAEPPLGRRRFDNLHAELSLALRVVIPRYELWLELHQWDMDPESLTQEQAMAFCEGPLASYLHRSGLSLRPRALRRLCRKIAKYDPTLLTPDERFATLPD
jgi:hypothetical protein